MLSRLSRNTGTWIEMNKGGLSMKAISRWLDRFCYKHPRFGIPNLMKYIVIGNVLVYFLDMFSHGYASYLLAFYPSRILHGEVWRLLTFLFIPVSGYSSGDMFSILWFAMSTLFYYYIGNALERQWGSTRFTVFYALGAILNMIIGFAFQSGVTMYYVNMSMFFSFATLYPDMQVMLYGILPLKVKWLAWLDAALFAYDIVFSLFARQWITAALPIIALLNYRHDISGCNLCFFHPQQMAVDNLCRIGFVINIDHTVIIKITAFHAYIILVIICIGDCNIILSHNQIGCLKWIFPAI